MADEKDFGHVIEFLSKINRRILSLEHEKIIFEKNITEFDTKSSNLYQLLHSKKDDVKASIFMSKNKMKNYNASMISLTRDLKSSLKKEEFESVSSRIDELRFEEYITKSDIDKLL